MGTQEKQILSTLLVRYPDLVRQRIVNNRTTLKRWVDDGEFPAPIKIGPNSIAWRADAVDEWLREREEATR